MRRAWEPECVRGVNANMGARRVGVRRVQIGCDSVDRQGVRALASDVRRLYLLIQEYPESKPTDCHQA
jgi:hypothetical protein